MYQGFVKRADLVYGQADGKELLLDLYVPLNPIRQVQLIVYVHGGGWAGLDRHWCPYAMRMLAQEYAVASIDYRLIHQAPFPACLHDCKAAVRWLRANAAAYGYDPERIGAWGDSAGGHLVAMLGLTAGVADLEGDSGTPGISSAVQAVCNYYGPADLERLPGYPADPPWGGEPCWWQRFLGADPAVDPDVARRASPVTYASRKAAPMLIVHGDKDTTVLLSQSVALYEALWQAGADVQLHVVHGGDHLSYEHRVTDLPWLTGEVDQLVDAFFYRTLRCR
ncbi:MAG: alpha/beta hydrolase [Chloroflexi bacterium]|nr:alpha/beta hydrolase [Chloroflexota bacterium]